MPLNVSSTFTLSSFKISFAMWSIAPFAMDFCPGLDACPISTDAKYIPSSVGSFTSPLALKASTAALSVVTSLSKSSWSVASFNTFSASAITLWSMLNSSTFLLPLTISFAALIASDKSCVFKTTFAKLVLSITILAFCSPFPGIIGPSPDAMASIASTQTLIHMNSDVSNTLLSIVYLNVRG